MQLIKGTERLITVNSLRSFLPMKQRLTGLDRLWGKKQNRFLGDTAHWLDHSPWDAPVTLRHVSYCTFRPAAPEPTVWHEVDSQRDFR